MSRKTKKCGYRKRILAGVLSAVVALSSVQMPVTALHAAAWDQNKFSDSLKLRFWNNEKPGVRFYINAAAKYILENRHKNRNTIQRITCSKNRRTRKRGKRIKRSSRKCRRIKS